MFQSQIIRANKALRLPAFPFDQLDFVDIILALPLDLALKLRLRHCMLGGKIPAKSSKGKMDRGNDHEQRDLPV